MTRSDRSARFEPPIRQPSTVAFAESVHVVSAEARRLSLRVPSFRSPPRGPFVRTIQRRPDGAVVVAIRVHGRDRAALRNDVIEGVLVANGLRGAQALAARRALERVAGGGSGCDRGGVIADAA